MLCAATHRGFESHPFRHDIVDCQFPIFDWPPAPRAIDNCQSAIFPNVHVAQPGITFRIEMKSTFTFAVIVAASLLTSVSANAQTHRPVKHGGQICGNPKISCKTSVTFQANDLPFQVGKEMVIVDTVPFYAVVLKSTTVKDDNCEVFIPESDRLAAQELR